MTAITPTELNLLRSKPHETNLWLSIYKPTVVLAAQVNAPGAAPGDRIANFDNVTEGSYLNIESGMTMYVGTTPGARDVGRVRVKSATSWQITMAENSDINWKDNLYLTVVKFWEINAVYPRMYVPDPADPTQQIWYKDYDIAYTNQNSSLGSFICMGSHFAGFLENGACQVYYSASGTYNLKGEALTYSWSFEGATVTGSSANTPGYVQYNTPGHYTTKLTVSGTSPGSSDTSYRHISIYNRPEEGTNVPILNWELEALDGTREAGGYTARIKVRENVDDVIDGALVVIFADDIYGGTKQSIGGNELGRQKIFFVGYILDGSISYNYEDSSIEFNVGSPSEMMKLSEGFAVALNSSSDPAGQDAADEDIPSAWALLLDMNCKRAIYHYLRWHSTVLQTNDFEFKGTDQYIEYFDADRESIYDAINNLMKGTLSGEVVCDRQGKIWSEVSMSAIDSATGTVPTVMSIFKQDWIGNPVIEESYNHQLGYLEMGGIQFTPAVSGSYVGASAAYLSCAPGSSPSYRGNVKTIEGLAVSSQNQLNTESGNVYAYLNSKYAHVELELAGNYRNLDIAPQEIISINIELNDTPRKLVWNAKAFHPIGMSWIYNPQAGTLLPTLTLHEVTQGYAGTSIAIPEIPPTPEPSVPPLPPIPPFPPFPVSSGWLFVYHNGVFVAAVSALNFVDSA